MIWEPLRLRIDCLLKLSSNPSLRSADFAFMNLSEEALVSFLETARSLTQFVIHSCHVEPSAVGDRSIAAALRRSRHMLSLTLERMGVSLLLPILRRLDGKEGLTQWRIHWIEYTAETSNAVRQLLESTSSIQQFSLEGRCSAETFHPIAQGLSRG